MCIKAVDTHPSTKSYVPGWYKTQEMCVNTHSFAFYSILNQCRYQEMCDKAADDNTYALELVLDWYKTQ